MADQTISWGFTFVVTVETPSHRQGFHLLSNFHAFDISVTACTINSSADVSLVRKTDIVWQVMDSQPGNRFFVFPVLKKFLNFRLVSQDGLVTADATFDRRNTGNRSTTCISVAEFALNLILPGMMRMAECNRLSGWIACNAGCFKSGRFDFSGRTLRFRR